jgi:periplasmic divalent cation tolerance protein
MNISLIYITAGSLDEARAIGRELVSLKLAACVNIIDHMESVYIWEGKIQNDNEVIIIAKTVESRVPELIEKVKTLHSYECPCIVSLPVSSGNKSFLDWIAAEVK